MPPTLRNQGSFALPIRGGDQTGVPVVPDDAITNDLPQGVSRGGSTKTEKYPRGVTISSPTATTLVSSASPAVASAKNVTSLEAEVSHAVTRTKKDKRHKRHKLIAKKLKVSVTLVIT